MGRTSRPLTIVVTDVAMLSWPEIEKLYAQGHNVGLAKSFLWETAPDLVLGPTCHMMTEAERPWLEDAIKAARKRRYNVPLTQEEETP